MRPACGEAGRRGQSRQEVVPAKLRLWSQHGGRGGGNEVTVLGANVCHLLAQHCSSPGHRNVWVGGSEHFGLSLVLAARAPVLFCRDWLLFFMVWGQAPAPALVPTVQSKSLPFTGHLLHAVRALPCMSSARTWSCGHAHLPGDWGALSFLHTCPTFFPEKWGRVNVKQAPQLQPSQRAREAAGV